MSKKSLIDVQPPFPALAKLGMKFFELNFLTGRLPVLRDLHPWTNKKKTNVSWLPINQNIQRTASTPAPAEVVADYINRARYLSIVDFCGCRRSFQCKDYPEEIGCLFMGESTLEIPSEHNHQVSRDKALIHLEKAVQANLVPVMGKARVDNFIFQVPDKGKLLTVCFCCECCCITRYMRHLPAERLNEIFVPLEGLSIEVDHTCIGCGTCEKKCFIGAITIKNGRSVIGEKCRLCGRCARFCPQGAIKLKLNNPRLKEDYRRRVDPHVQIG